MALKYIPTSWQDDMRTNFNAGTNFFLNPRGRVFPALTSTGVSYIKNDKSVNMRGTYRMQTGATTDLTYLYTLPQRFIIEGWFKPKWAYDVATDQVIFSAEKASQCSIKYEADTDTIDVYLSGSLRASTPAYTSNGELQRWIYIRLICDVDATYYQLYIYQNGTEIKNTNGPVTTSIIALNEISFFSATPAESSYWIIHELDELLATGEYKTYQADRQIIFDFNGTTLGRERIRIPLVHAADDERGVLSFSMHKEVENPDTGSAGANSASLTLQNKTGSFSDDQYDAFDPFNGYYNGPQKYLQNRVAVEIESVSPENIVRNGALAWYLSGDLPDIPDSAAGITYVSNFATTDGWAANGGSCTVSVASGKLHAAGNGSRADISISRIIAGSHGKTVRAKIAYDADITAMRYFDGTTPITITPIHSGDFYYFDFVPTLIPTSYGACILYVYYANATIQATKAIDYSFIYVGTGEYDYPLIDGSGNANHAKVYRALPIQDTLGQMLRFNGINASATIPATSELAKQFAKVGGIVGASFWVRPLAATAMAPMLYVADIANNNRMYFRIANATTLQLVVFNGTASLAVLCATNELAHIVVARSGVTGKGYAWKNGIFVGELAQTAAVAGTDTAVQIGTGSGAYGNFDLFGLRFFDFLPTNAQAAEMYRLSSDFGIISGIEPMFIGRTTAGAFRRDSPSKFEGTATIEAEDGVSELGETIMASSHAFDTFKLSDPTTEASSLVHSIVRLVTKKEIKNYALNSSVENATLASSFTNNGMATFERSSTYAQFGICSMKCIANTIGDTVTQVVKFETNDLIDVGDTFNFSVFIRQGTASAVKIIIEELTNAGALVGTGSETACGTDTGVFTRVNVARTIQAATCTQLRMTLYAVKTSTFYADGFMLTRGIDPVDYFVLNANDGASGSGSAESYTAATYDTVAIDADAVDVEHPYAVVNQGGNVWEDIKAIGDAGLANYVGMTEDGVFRFASRYAETDPDVIGDVEDFGAISTQLEINTVNSVKVKGITIEKETGTSCLWNGNTSGCMITVDNKLRHPIEDGTYMSVKGATTLEMPYSEDS
jgi:hypothetical protein